MRHTIWALVLMVLGVGCTPEKAECICMCGEKDAESTLPDTLVQDASSEVQDVSREVQDASREVQDVSTAMPDWEICNCDDVPQTHGDIYETEEIDVAPPPPGDGILIELLWHTPGDPDETDTGLGVGADLDLHLLHPWASGPDLDGDGKPDGWFDNLFDCFWFNPYPNWGDYNPAIKDDPSLDGEDTDGVGPEIITLRLPEDGNTYRVGVHYWNDHGFGESHATVRIYIDTELVFERAGVPLKEKDMWEVATIEWPSKVVLPLTGRDGGHKVTPNYENPYFFQD